LKHGVMITHVSHQLRSIRNIGTNTSSWMP